MTESWPPAGVEPTELSVGSDVDSSALWVQTAGGSQVLYVRSDADDLSINVNAIDVDATSWSIVSEQVHVVVRQLSANAVRVGASSGGTVILDGARVSDVEFKGGEIHLVGDSMVTEAHGHIEALVCQNSVLRGSARDVLTVGGTTPDERPLNQSFLSGLCLPEDPIRRAEFALAATSCIVFDPLPSSDPGVIEDGWFDSQVLLIRALRVACPSGHMISQEVRTYYRARQKTGHGLERITLYGYSCLGYGVDVKLAVCGMVAASVVVAALVSSWNARVLNWEFGISHWTTSAELLLDVLSQPLQAIGRQPTPATLSSLPAWLLAVIRGLLILCYGAVVLSVRSNLQALRRVQERSS